MSKIILTAVILLIFLFQFPKVINAASINPDPIPDIQVGQVIGIKVSGLETGRLYYWEELNVSDTAYQYIYCFPADGSGEINQSLGPYTAAGSYTMIVSTATADSFESNGPDNCRPDVPVIGRSYNVTPSTTVSTNPCNPPRISSTNNGTNTCTYTKREGSRALPGECPAGYQLTENNCNTGYLPTLIRTTTTYRCECVTEGTPICQSSLLSCTSAEECQAGAGCENYVCLGYIGSRTPGRCVDSTTLCSKNAITCASDNDCRDGTEGCSNYYCWGGGIGCRYGPRPTPTPLPVSPVSAGGSQCGTEANPGFNTAIGCIPTNPNEFVKALLEFVIGISGGLAFLLMLLGAFQMLTSAGNPETLTAGKDRFTQAIIGLLFVIFSVLLLQIIGVDILGLRELGK
ncbi:hypothetical protein A3B45_02750 [Candidatus Daviesbacteria bacterium RIFCSPLOWO2_01_FULL_39_12]|uniref:Uncharacterized protein n=1 Tax=Candidatus Daviesbacteria bacterium RIFCSPLOWO2_01_FULL_39_12 TaxID=1797785 RepID=A0A1F5KSW7_9BACT|nr:MAG: hypothetical protein A3D79_02470 [Candidatus Daviesbacteria bacterium RIFCSPHIGHO2_02_FULL_39_8]OGE43924.1 MAG: hypothetical protein A3B45_02750 [Candidatus Daviesbacteria bacterium RIFCSPLOWO2_01_FULL_39_12]